MPSRHLEDHIRDLCAKAIAAPETELEPALSELKSALREHTARLRQMVAENLAKTKAGHKSSVSDTIPAYQDLKETSTTE